MTNQDAFTLMVQHLRTQGGPSYDPNRGCLYRHPDGIRRCAVGVLIKDTDYYPAMEDCKVLGLGPVPSLQGIEGKLLHAMQTAHDKVARLNSSHWGETMEKQYKLIAEKFNLVVSLHPCGIPQDHTITPEVDTLIHQPA